MVYVGRTRQPLRDRLRGHFFGKPTQRKLDIFKTTRIEYAVFPTTADMYLYEIYYINKYKPKLNRDDKARDSLTVTLPETEWLGFELDLMSKWRDEITRADEWYGDGVAALEQCENSIYELKKRKAAGLMDEDDYLDQLDRLRAERDKLRSLV